VTINIIGMNKTEHSKKALLEALEKSLGVVTTACKKAEIGRTTYYKWLESDEQFKKDVEEISNTALDFVESKLFEQIEDGSTSAAIFYLKTKGKKRGYIEKQELDLTSGEEPIQINIKVNGEEH